MTGVGWPPRSETRDSAKAELPAQADLAVAAGTGAAADRELPGPHAVTTRRQAKMQPPDAAGCNIMLV